jgi:Flp pilus assembly protein TadG
MTSAAPIVRSKRRGRAARGQASVELAAFLPFFVLLLLGMIELGHAWHVANLVAQAAHEGVEQVRRTRSTDPSDVVTVVAQVAGERAVAEVTTAPATSVRDGVLATVRVTVDEPLVTGPFLRLFTAFRDGTVRIERSATALLVP